MASRKKPEPREVQVFAAAAAPRDRDLRIRVAGYMPRKARVERQIFRTYGIGLVGAGRGRYRARRGSAQSVEPGSVFCVYPGELFEYGPAAGTTWEEYYLSPEGPGVKRWIARGWLPVDGSVHPVRNFAMLRDLFVELLHALKDPGPGAADRSVCIAERIVVEMFYARTSFEQRSFSQSMHDVLAVLRQRFAEPLDFESLARAHAISYSTLRHRLREMTGAGPAEYLASLRCNEARRLLAETEWPVKTIALRVGIPDPYAFSRVFKRFEGVSPQRYREQARDWLQRT